MSDALLAACLDAALGAIEARELRSLVWGSVDGSLSEDELADLVRPALGELGAPTDDGEVGRVCGELLAQRALFEVARLDGTFGYRSRFAEGIRLLTQLRQWFPDESWAAARTLVSDYRVDARPRSFPRRDVPVDAAIGALGLAPATLEYEAARAILTRNGRELPLAQFQVDASRLILRDARRDRGVVVSAGTGSGKTLAFYLPALIDIAPLVVPGQTWVKALTVYPRTELLKDQFSEAFVLARRMDDVLRARGKRPITIGTFFGMTPNNADARSLERHWRQIRGIGWVCPFLRCPECDGEMVWPERERATGREALTCLSPGCPGSAGPDQIVLTRERAEREPPDIVFATLEMVHQRIADTRRRQIIGLHQDPNRRARMVLLDEIHTYEGTTGAQSALALRRWRHVLGRTVRWVGLSATLLEAPRFFSDLVGLDQTRVEEVTPRPEELVTASMAYQVILRADPASQTSVLSTSIQTAFLLARLLDPPTRSTADGRYGHRLFVFTDDLDVTNRLYDNLGDAEGYDWYGRPRGELPLAALRAPSPPGTPELPARNLAGQVWRAPERIGWQLCQSLRVSRTTSQDSGVDAGSDIVVATASLEVGFDDPNVGAVLQHKAPRQFASFVQRKGRAGRSRTMRPWMVTVLSDYGRDRLAYQAYDRLFEPILPPQTLPVSNSYILRMQSVFAFVDWLADQALKDPGFEGNRKLWWWWPLNGPSDDSPYAAAVKRQQRWVLGILRELRQENGSRYISLRTYLAGALRLDLETVTSLLWEPPRSLMLEVVPTLARRLHTGWQAVPDAGVGLHDVFSRGSSPLPLPDFVPPNLFSELILPEVTVIVPPDGRRGKEQVHTMPVTQALKQLAPGRVTRRFGQARGELNHWLPIPLGQATCTLPISSYAEGHEYLGTVTVRDEAGPTELPCYRPWTVRLAQVSSRTVGPTSNARMHWASQLVPPESAELTFPTRRDSGWGAVVASVQFYVHAHRLPIAVRRFATGVTATIRRPRRADDLVIRATFVDAQHRAAAVGFEQEVDGLVVRARLPDGATLAALAAASPNLRAWRADYVRQWVLSDPVLAAYGNVFRLDWLWHVYLSTVAREVAQSGLPPGLAAARLRSMPDRFRALMRTAFRVQSADGLDDADAEDAVEQRPTPRLVEALDELLSTSEVLDRLQAAIDESASPDRACWQRWLLRRAHETLGEAVLFACQALAPNHAALDTLLMDLGRDLPGRVVEGLHEVWVTESTPGGTGTIESILTAFAEEPRRFYAAIETALAPSDLEVTSRQLDEFVELVHRVPAVADALAAARVAESYTARDVANAALVRQLAGHGLGVGHAFRIAIGHRLLRGGFDATGDGLVRRLLQAWRRLEGQLGLTVDVRTFAVAVLDEDDLADDVRAWVRTTAGANLGDADVAAVVAGILWPRPSEIRGRSLEAYNPYRDRERTDPALLRELVLEPSLRRVKLSAGAWEAELRAALSADGRVALDADRTDEDQLHRRLLELIATPIDVGYLQFFPAIESVQHDSTGVTATLILPEISST